MCPSEADHQLVHLVRSGICNYVLTIDGDVQSGRGAVYQVPESHESCPKGRESLVWTFLLGRDYEYTHGVHGIGPKLAIEVLQACNGTFDCQTVASAIIEVPQIISRIARRAVLPVLRMHVG